MAEDSDRGEEFCSPTRSRGKSANEPPAYLSESMYGVIWKTFETMDACLRACSRGPGSQARGLTASLRARRPGGNRRRARSFARGGPARAKRGAAADLR